MSKVCSCSSYSFNMYSPSLIFNRLLRLKKSYRNTKKVKEKYNSKEREIQPMAKVMLDRWVEWEWQGKTQVATINRTNSLWQMFPLAVVIMMMMVVSFCLNMIYLENYKNTPSLKSILLARGEVLLGKASDLCMLCTHGKDIHTFTICVCSQVISACILCITRHTVCL